MIQMKDSENEHFLLDKWNCWAHLPHDSDWSLSSYKKITTIHTMESAARYIENFPENDNLKNYNFKILVGDCVYCISFEIHV